MGDSIFNFLLRGITLGSKFLFILFLAKYSIDEVNLGVYGIFSTSIVLLIYVLGFDFYVFNTREILNVESGRSDKIRYQLIFHLITYCLVIPLALICIFRFDFISSNYFWVFFLLIFSEHLGQESYRLLATIQKSVTANLLLFVRSGLWIWYILFDFFVLSHEINLKSYFEIWLIFSWISLFISIIVIVKCFNISSLRGTVDWGWIISGIKTSSIFFIGSLSFQVIQLSDRYMLDYFYGKKMVGIYTAYAQFANAIDVFTFSAVTILAYPKLIMAAKDRSLYEKLKKKFSKELLIVTGILSLVVALLGPHIFVFLNKRMLIEELSSFYLLIFGTVALIISNIFHYDLFVKKKDHLILIIALIAMVFNAILNLILIPIYGVFGASVSTVISFLIILSLKWYFSIKINKL